MLKFKPLQDTELRSSLKSANQVYVDQFDEPTIAQALFDAKRCFINYKQCQNVNDIAMHSFDTRIVTIEQGVHQPEEITRGGFKLHFMDRDNSGVAFHFYIKQLESGKLQVTEMLYFENGLKQFARQ